MSAINDMMLKDMVTSSNYGSYVIFRYVTQSHLCGAFHTGRWEPVSLELGPDQVVALEQDGWVSSATSVPYIVRFDIVDVVEERRSCEDEKHTWAGSYEDYPEYETAKEVHISVQTLVADNCETANGGLTYQVEYYRMPMGSMVRRLTEGTECMSSFKSFFRGVLCGTESHKYETL